MLFKTFNVHRVDSSTGSDQVIGSFRTGVANMEAKVLLENYVNFFDHAKQHCAELKEDMNKIVEEQGACQVQYFLSVDGVHSKKFVVRMERQGGHELQASIV
ncbi:hypothetical protein EON63_12170 [archaeon]|nr:MAG: hypothetical protein EON63_12170 [archaeon]